MSTDPSSPLHEITPPRGGPPRYTRRPFPAYRYVPGFHPHPVSHPAGHSHHPDGHHPAAGPLVVPERWFESQDYLYGADLYNHGYFWEAHEAWEGLWQQTDKAGRQGRFLQGLIQVSAAHLKRHMGQPEGVGRLLGRAFAHLEAVQEAGEHAPMFMGLSLPSFLAIARRHFAHDGSEFPFIRLAGNPLVRA